MPLETNDQIDGFDRLDAACLDLGVEHNLSTKDFIEALHQAGLRLVPGDQTDTLKILAKPEWSE